MRRKEDVIKQFFRKHVEMGHIFRDQCRCLCQIPAESWSILFFEEWEEFVPDFVSKEYIRRIGCIRAEGKAS